MKKLHFKKGKLSIIAIIVLSVIAFISLITLLVGVWFGLIGFLPMVVYFAVKEGVYIDLEKRMYKSYLSIFGITPAQWKPLPEGTRIGVRSVKLVATRNFVIGGLVGAIPTGSIAEEHTMELFLYLPKPERVVLNMSKNAKKLYEQAQFIHQHLGYEIVVDKRIPEDKYL